MISFVIPTLNEEKVLEKTLKQISKYTGEKEIIVSDDNSKDRTVEIAKKYTDKVFIRSVESKKGPSANRNFGASKACGEYIVFIDADIFIPEIDSYFSNLLGCFDKDKKIVGMTVCIRILPELETFLDKTIMSILNGFYFFANNILNIGTASGEFQIVKRVIYEKVGGFNEGLFIGEDVEFFNRVSKHGKTRIAMDIAAFNDGRRVHVWGWSKLLSQWIINGLAIMFFKKPVASEWKEIR